MSTETYLLLCKEAGLTVDDMDCLTIGMCLDYIQEYFDIKHPNKNKARKAKQSDFDAF
mgnify:CR=1 FL=1